MPVVRIEAFEIDVPRNAALVDTNALVAFVDKNDRYHEEAVLILESDTRYQWLVLPPVLGEACGLLTSKKQRPKAVELLRWIITPGNVIAPPSLEQAAQFLENISDHADRMERYRVDLVDAYLMTVADHLTTECNLNPHAPILTADTRDFFASVGRKYSIYDLKSPGDDLIVLS